MLFALSYFDTDVSKKVNTGGKKPNKIFNKETEHTQILPLSWCMQNYSSLLFFYVGTYSVDRFRVFLGK